MTVEIWKNIYIFNNIVDNVNDINDDANENNNNEDNCNNFSLFGINGNDYNFFEDQMLSERVAHIEASVEDQQKNQIPQRDLVAHIQNMSRQ